jgi:cytochrome c553
MKQLITLIVVATFFGCQKSEKPSYIQKSQVLGFVQEKHPGKKLMEMQCYVCHHPKATPENRIAPPMIAIKNHYLTKGISKEDFIKEIQKFVKNPTAENSKMPGAVKKFGVMPKQYYSDKTIREIADYLYDNDVEKNLQIAFGQICEMIKKYNFRSEDKHPTKYKFSVALNLFYTSVLFYISEELMKMGSYLEECLEQNVDKLTDRYNLQ